MTTLPRPFDPMCQRFGADIGEYRDAAISADPETIEHYIRGYEGTYNSANGHFLCTACYIAAGMPTSPGGWRCP